MTTNLNGPRQIHDLPETVVLGEGEVLRYRADFSPYLVMSHLRVTMLLTDRRVIVQRPHTLFGFVPRGYSEQSSPVDAVCEVISGEQVSSRKIASGAFFGLFGLYLLFGLGGPVGILLGLVLLGCAAFQILSSQSMGVFVRNHGAGILAAPAGRAERAEVDRAKLALSEVLYARRGSSTL